MRKWLIGAALGALVCASASAQETGFDRPYWLDRAVIEAIGRAEIEFPPDRATFSVTFQETAHEARDAEAQAADRARLAAAAIRRRGGEGVKIQSSVSVQPVYHQYTDHQGQHVDSDRPDQIDNYVARVELSVEVNDTAHAADARAAAMAVGPENTEDVSYSLRDTAEQHRRVFAAAAEDAAARAHVAAQASGARLGALLVLQEGQGPCLGSWRGDRPGMVGPPPPPPPPSPRRAGEQDEAIVVTGSRINGTPLRLTAEDIARLNLPEDLQPLTLTAQVCAVYSAAPAAGETHAEPAPAPQPHATAHR